jgi:mono/diheme cytochrome c family protein
MKLKRILFALPLFIFFCSCNWGHEPENAERQESQATADAQAIKAPSEAKKGVGPIKEPVELGPTIDEEMAAKGEQLFNEQCATCHEIHDTNRGPALGGVLDKRSPQFVMNMILNPEGMIANDPQIKALKAVYEIDMVDLNLSETQARELVEYLRKF